MADPIPEKKMGVVRVAVTGHRDLTADSAGQVAEHIRDRLRPHARSLVGISCLAEGTDQIFADIVLDLGGDLMAVVCAENQRAQLPDQARERYDRLLAAACEVRRLPFATSTPDAHHAANLAMLDAADELIAVWDGGPARGRGGTAEVVQEAERRGIRVSVIWPSGADRSRGEANVL